MGIFLIFGGLLLVCVIWYIITILLDRRDTYYTDYSGGRFFSIVAGLSIVVIICLILTLIDIDRQFNEIVNKHEALSELIENSRENNTNSFETIKAIDNMTEMNNIISNHKAYIGSFWTGAWYSDKVANLPYLK